MLTLVAVSGTGGRLLAAAPQAPTETRIQGTRGGGSAGRLLDQLHRSAVETTSFVYMDVEEPPARYFADVTERSPEASRCGPR